MQTISGQSQSEGGGSAGAAAISNSWVKQAQFGMMIHWGLYALPAGEWRGRRMPGIGEWLQSYFRIPNQEYGALAGAFNPILFDAEAWVQLALDAGMRYLVVTSKHHDGFAMYHSRVDAYNICDATPFKRDVIAELAEACRKNGLKLGLYYSQALDWHEQHGGGYKQEPGRRPMSWCNDWDFPDSSRKDYGLCFEKKIKPQVEELLRNYGDLCLIWFDMPKTISPEQSFELFQLIKRYQPDCLVNTRIGNGLGDYRSMGDNQIPDEFMQDALVETPATLNDTWGYKAFDQNWKPAEEVLRLKRHLQERGVNYLLNVGPDYLGRIPAPSADILRSVGGADPGGS
ncbi:MAG: alpha-L-fucosidase [Lentisphaerae bacterium]|nr:alpha-L-fucosidase [Lentisphaerota bacterium]